LRDPFDDFDARRSIAHIERRRSHGRFWRLACGRRGAI